MESPTRPTVTCQSMLSDNRPYCTIGLGDRTLLLALTAGALVGMIMIMIMIMDKKFSIILIMTKGTIILDDISFNISDSDNYDGTALEMTMLPVSISLSSVSKTTY